MPYVTSVERLARQEGILESSREDVIEVLRVRFELVPNQLVETINQIESVSVLKTLLRQAVSIGSVEEFQLFLEHQLASGDKEEQA